MPISSCDFASCDAEMNRDWERDFLVVYPELEFVILEVKANGMGIS